MISRQTSLSKNTVQFCRFLRQKGFSLSVEEESTALNALQYIDYSNRKVFQLTLKAVCCRSKTQLSEFDDLFNEYWKEIAKAVDSKIKSKEQSSLKPTIKDEQFKSLKSWLHGNSNKEIEEIASYSIYEN